MIPFDSCFPYIPKTNFSSSWARGVSLHMDFLRDVPGLCRAVRFALFCGANLKLY